jgi:hypothetical protein
MAVEIPKVLFSLTRGVMIGIDRSGIPQWANEQQPKVLEMVGVPTFKNQEDADIFLNGRDGEADYPHDVQLREVPTAIGKKYADPDDIKNAGMSWGKTF